MGFGGLNIATSGIRAAQTNLAVTGHNISNSEIPGFSRQRIVQTTAFARNIGMSNANVPMSFNMGTDWTAVHQIRNEFLDVSYRQNIGRLTFYSTVVQAGMVVENLLGELHGSYNFQSVLNDMWSSIQELSANPGGIDTRHLFLATTNSLLNKAQDVMDGLIDYQHNLDQQIRAMVDEINRTASEINRLNNHIRAEEAVGDNANDARDERNRLIDRMAEMIPIDVFTAPDGDVIIISQGHTIVSQGFVNQLGLRFLSNESSFVEPVFTRSRDILSAGTPPHEFIPFTNYRRPINNENANDLGQLNGLLMARGTAPANHMTGDTPSPTAELAALMTELGGLTLAGAVTARDTAQSNLTAAETALAATTPGTPAHDAALIVRDNARADLTTAIRELNDVLRRDALLDPDTMAADTHNWNALMWSIQNAKIPGVQMNLDRIVNSVVTMINDALTGNLRTVDANGVEHYVFRDASGNPIIPRDMNGDPGIPLFIRKTDDENATWPFTDVNPNQFNTIFTINNIQINPAFLEANGHNFLALSNSGAPDDNTLLLALQTVWLANSGPYAVNIGGRYFGVQDAYIRFTGDIATRISEANSFVSAQTIQVQQADALRQSVKGVSMDEELNNMLRFQFAFQAASRVFNMVDSMIDQVVNRTGRVGL
ncbi:MAG: hypothetical protein FWE05_04995 [Defluviitaleaceae bacterium]|nr:hypothetical protein [Defluviitaleaceae bacterium]